MDKLIETLSRLSQLNGPSGYEDEVRRFIISEAGKFAEGVETDFLGNVYATVQGESSNSKIIVDAHMDEVGFMIKYVEPRGFLRFEPLGTIDPKILPGKRLSVKGDHKSYHGTIGSRPPHIITGEEANRVTPLSELYIDIGANSPEEVKSLGISPGSIATFEEQFQELAGGRMIMGKAFDDRAGCTISLSILESLSKEKPRLTVVFAFTVQEEVGLRGAEVAANHVRPDIGIALETTVAADVPDARPRDWISELGGGPTIRVLDSTMMAQRQMVEYLGKTAEENNIPHQMQIARAGGTDAGRIHLSGSGVPTGLISTPCRYLHGPSSVLNTEDFQNVARLAEAAVRGIGSKDQFKF
jgi:tetrahedral aminopeptidase